MLQHFESVSVGIPQPKFAIGARVAIAGNWGTITGMSFYGLNDHPTQSWRDGWEYQVSYDCDSPDWYLLDGQDWHNEANVMAAVCQQIDSGVGLKSQSCGNSLVELCHSIV